MRIKQTAVCEHCGWKSGCDCKAKELASVVASSSPFRKDHVLPFATIVLKYVDQIEATKLLREMMFEIDQLLDRS